MMTIVAPQNEAHKMRIKSTIALLHEGMFKKILFRIHSSLETRIELEGKIRLLLVCP